MGYESAILIASRKNGYKETILKEAKFEHTPPLGQKNDHFY